MTEIMMLEITGDFAENKDLARQLRRGCILPTLNSKEDVILNFKGVNGATQSFIHALISEIIREKGIDVLDNIIFKNCNTTIKKIINIVVEYMQNE